LRAVQLETLNAIEGNRRSGVEYEVVPIDGRRKLPRLLREPAHHPELQGSGKTPEGFQKLDRRHATHGDRGEDRSQTEAR